MPSSISSSEAPAPRAPERDIPEKPYFRMLAVAVVVVIVGFSLWEMEVRAMGYTPSFNDTPNLWSRARERAVGASRQQIVFVGASRTAFDIDLGTFERGTGGPRPIQLATVGSNPMVIFTHLAEDPTYAGTTIVGVVPGLLAAPGGPPVKNPQKYVSHYDAWQPSQRFELLLSMFLQEHLAFVQETDLTLRALLGRIPIDDRAGAKVPPTLPPAMRHIDGDRQSRMWERVETDRAFRERIQQIWLPLFTPPPPPPIFTPEAWKAMLKEKWTETLRQAKKNVEAIESRGGRVLFVRFPSTGGVRDIEKKLVPREAIWEPLLEATGAPGIHFEDYPELHGFDCPEWSHLTADDAVLFSERLLAILKAKRLLD